MISALRKVREDKAVKAVVLRIDSPGAPRALVAFIDLLATNCMQVASSGYFIHRLQIQSLQTCPPPALLPPLSMHAGGSAAASDAIHREVLLLRKAGKPVVVSMGNAAASGERPGLARAALAALVWNSWPTA